MPMRLSRPAEVGVEPLALAPGGGAGWSVALVEPRA